MSKEALLNEVQELARKLGRTPIRNEFKSYNKAARIFGSWNSFLRQAGLKLNVEDYSDYTDEELLVMIKEDIIRIGSTTFENYYKNKSSSTPSFTYIKKRFGFKWNDLLEKLNLEINQKDMADEDLLKLLKDIANELGNTPTMNELQDRGINASIYQTRFGAYNKALELAGLEVNFERSKVVHTNEELLEMYIELCNRLGKPASAKDIDEYLEYNSDVFSLRFGGMNDLRKVAGYEKIKHTKKYSKDSISMLLLDEYKKYNRSLTNHELIKLSKENKDFPGINTICRHFKTTKMSEVWDEIIKLV